MTVWSSRNTACFRPTTASARQPSSVSTLFSNHGAATNELFAPTGIFQYADVSKNAASSRWPAALVQISWPPSGAIQAPASAGVGVNAAVRLRSRSPAVDDPVCALAPATPTPTPSPDPCLGQALPVAPLPAQSKHC